MIDVDRRQKPVAAEREPQFNGFAPQPPPPDPLRPASRLAAAPGARGTYNPVLDDYLSPRLVELGAQIKAEPRPPNKARRPPVPKRPKRKRRSLPPACEYPEAVAGIAVADTAPGTPPDVSHLPPVADSASSPPVDGAGQPGGQAESPAANRRPRRKSLAGDVKQFAARLRRQYAGQIEADPRGFKKRVRGLLGRHLPPFAGRPMGESINRAVELRSQGLEWKEIYPLVIPDHARLDPFVRRQAESNLRAAPRSRRNARRRRKRERKKIAESNPTENVPLGNVDLRA